MRISGNSRRHGTYASLVMTILSAIFLASLVGRSGALVPTAAVAHVGTIDPPEQRILLLPSHAFQQEGRRSLTASTDDDGPSRKRWSQPRMEARPGAVQPDPVRIADAVRTGVQRLLELQEAAAESAESSETPDGPRCEWPYECVYKEGGGPPAAFRVGGTSIVGLALLAAPGLQEDGVRRAALVRAADAVARLATHERIAFEHEASGFDVRNWAHCFGLRFLLRMERSEILPEDRRAPVRAAIERYAGSLLHTARPGKGGWHYMRIDDVGMRGESSSFLTAHCIIALVEARDAGVEPLAWESPEGTSSVPSYDAIIAKALDAIESARLPDGFLGYDTRRAGAFGPGHSRRGMPECMGRRLIADVAAARAGRPDLERARSSLALFRASWEDLDAQRGIGGAHREPFGIAPYYFFFAVTAAADAARLCPPDERDAHLAFIRALVLSIRAPDGTWNDQDYPGSAAYGTAMSILALVDPAASGGGAEQSGADGKAGNGASGPTSKPAALDRGER